MWYRFSRFGRFGSPKDGLDTQLCAQKDSLCRVIRLSHQRAYLTLQTALYSVVPVLIPQLLRTQQIVCKSLWLPSIAQEASSPISGGRIVARRGAKSKKVNGKRVFFPQLSYIPQVESKIDRVEAKQELVEQALEEGTAYLGTSDHVSLTYAWW